MSLDSIKFENFHYFRYKSTVDGDWDYPEDSFDNFCEEVSGCYTSEFWKEIRNGFMNSDTELNWMSKLYEKGYDYEETAKIIQRTYRRYKC